MTNIKKSSKQFALILLSLLMVFSCNICASAAEDDGDYGIQPMYTTIATNSAYILISGIKAHCNASVTVKAPTSLKTTLELQKEKSNGYETIKTWSKTDYGTGMSYTETRNINIFSHYRLKATITAGSETVVVYAYPSK